MNKWAKQTGFTIVELLIVIVVIGILAGIAMVAYSGIKRMAEDASLQSATSQMTRKVLNYKTENGDVLPSDTTQAGLVAADGQEVYYRLTPDGKQFCLAVNMAGDIHRAFSTTSTNTTAKQGTCRGYIHVPGNPSLGTTDFWVMKYEAKNVNNIPTSQPANTPWVSISQTNAIIESAKACDGCHLVTEEEWMTIAGNVLSVASNWSGGSVGSGFIYSGHTDNIPARELASSDDDSNGYHETGNVGNSSQKRTLVLSNGETVWDFAGNIWEWTTAVQNMSNVGIQGSSSFDYLEWTDPALSMGNLPTVSRPSVLASQAQLSSITGWNSINGVGKIHANYADTSLRAFRRGGDWSNTGGGGVLALILNVGPSYVSAHIGFRVAR